MNWHIITGSKGGSGKTLLSLMLTNYSRMQGEVLVLDLNGMNADISRLIANHNTSSYTSVTLDMGKFRLEKPEGESYIVGWPEDAFTLLNIQDFQQFFLQVRERIIPKIISELSFGISTIIIDTNYHFCNIFPNRLRTYSEEPFSSFGQNGSDNLFIWFLWTYRQLKNILEASDNASHPHYSDVRTLMERAVFIENGIRNRVLESSPFVHVFNPFSFGQFLSLQEGLFTKLGGWMNPNPDPVTRITPLEQLHRLRLNQLSGSVEFNALITTLKNIKKRLLDSKRKFSSSQDLFVSLLEEYANMRKEQGCPRNLIPLFIFQKDMVGYTENDYKDLLNDLNEVYLYKNNFAPACGKLFSP